MNDKNDRAGEEASAARDLRGRAEQRMLQGPTEEVVPRSQTLAARAARLHRRS
jgi:hypothetical protein